MNSKSIIDKLNILLHDSDKLWIKRKRKINTFHLFNLFSKVLVNNNGIKHNYDFINFAYKYWILPLSTSERDKKIYIKRVESLGLLVELSYDLLEKYFCNNYTYNNSNNDASPVSSQ